VEPSLNAVAEFMNFLNSLVRPTAPRAVASVERDVVQEPRQEQATAVPDEQSDAPTSDAPVLLVLNPAELAEKYRIEGNTAFMARNYEAAAAAYDQTVEAEPTNAKNWLNRSLARFNCHLFQESLEDADHVVELEPKYHKVPSLSMSPIEICLCLNTRK
jgi:hypothetical protein